MKIAVRFLILTVIFGLLLSACYKPSTNPNTGPGGATLSGQDAINTAAAQTIQAMKALTPISPGGGGQTVPPPPPQATTQVPPPPPPPQATTQVPPPPPPVATTAVPPTPIPCDWANFVTDVTIPDGTSVNPGQTVTKTWRLKNAGTCTWNSGYSLVFDSGDAMGAPASSTLTSGTVAPGQTVDVSVNITAPAATGTKRAYFKLRNGSGVLFGIGNTANKPFWVEVNVVAVVTTVPAGPVMKYDFAENYCDAKWIGGDSGGGTILTCPGGTGDATGFVVRKDNPKLQNGTTYTGKAIETHPKWVDNGVISGKYIKLKIKPNYHFKATIGCLDGGAACNVIFQLNYEDEGGTLHPLGSWNMSAGAAPQNIDVNLTPLAETYVYFALAVMANGPSTQDWAMWVNPRMEKVE